MLPPTSERAGMMRSSGRVSNFGHDAFAHWDGHRTDSARKNRKAPFECHMSENGKAKKEHQGKNKKTNTICIKKHSQIRVDQFVERAHQPLSSALAESPPPEPFNSYLKGSSANGA